MLLFYKYKLLFSKRLRIAGMINCSAREAKERQSKLVISPHFDTVLCRAEPKRVDIGVFLHVWPRVVLVCRVRPHRLPLLHLGGLAGVALAAAGHVTVGLGGERGWVRQNFKVTFKMF